MKFGSFTKRFKMINCKICNKDFKNLKCLSSHLKEHNTSTETYYNIYLNKDNDGKCLNCGNPTKYISLTKGYNNYCCIRCANTSDILKNKRKETNLKRYGNICSLVNDRVQLKVKQTLLKNLGVEHPSKSNKIKEKIKNNNLEKYGVSNVFQVLEHQKKYRETNLLKYGNEYPIRTKQIQEKIKQSCSEKYGVNHYSKTDEFKRKFSDTCRKKYGEDNPFKNKKCREKYEHTMLKKYGMVNPFFDKLLQLKIKENKRINFFTSLLTSNRLKDKVIPAFDLNEYINSETKYYWICTDCKFKFFDGIYGGRVPKCPKCYPFGKSKYELEIIEFIKDFGIDCYSTRSIIYPKELDIYIPSHKLAIEFNGLYWHSDLLINDPFYHLNKTLECQSKGIQLLHIFEDEWINHKDILKRIIKDKLDIEPIVDISVVAFFDEIYNNYVFADKRYNYTQKYIDNGYTFLYIADPTFFYIVDDYKTRQRYKNIIDKNTPDVKIWNCGYDILLKGE